MQNAVILVAVLGGIFGLVLAIAGRKFAVDTDPRIDEIAALLPGANCGSCGYAGCCNMAEAIVAGEAPDASKCMACPADNQKAINAVMGKSTDNTGTIARKVARLACNGCKTNAPRTIEYAGIPDCHVVAKNFGGPGQCNYGCLGFGSCEKACPFHAITMGDNGLPQFDYTKCVGCGICVKQCPQMVLYLADAGTKIHIMCNNRDKGKAAMVNCKVSCISCGICVKSCPQQAITLEDGPNGSLPVIDYDKCISCGICVSKCPRKCIHILDAVDTSKPLNLDKPENKTGCSNCALSGSCGSAK